MADIRSAAGEGPEPRVPDQDQPAQELANLIAQSSTQSDAKGKGFWRRRRRKSEPPASTPDSTDKPTEVDPTRDAAVKQPEALSESAATPAANGSTPEAEKSPADDESRASASDEPTSTPDERATAIGELASATDEPAPDAAHNQSAEAVNQAANGESSVATGEAASEAANEQKSNAADEPAPYAADAKPAQDAATPAAKPTDHPPVRPRVGVVYEPEESPDGFPLEYGNIIVGLPKAEQSGNPAEAAALRDAAPEATPEGSAEESRADPEHSAEAADRPDVTADASEEKPATEQAPESEPATDESSDSTPTAEADVDAAEECTETPAEAPSAGDAPQAVDDTADTAVDASNEAGDPAAEDASEAAAAGAEGSDLAGVAAKAEGAKSSSKKNKKRAVAQADAEGDAPAEESAGTAADASPAGATGQVSDEAADAAAEGPTESGDDAAEGSGEAAEAAAESSGEAADVGAEEPGEGSGDEQGGDPPAAQAEADETASEADGDSSSATEDGEAASEVAAAAHGTNETAAHGTDETVADGTDEAADGGPAEADDSADTAAEGATGGHADADDSAADESGDPAAPDAAADAAAESSDESAAAHDDAGQNDAGQEAAGQDGAEQKDAEQANSERAGDGEDAAAQGGAGQANSERAGDGEDAAEQGGAGQGGAGQGGDGQEGAGEGEEVPELTAEELAERLAAEQAAMALITALMKLRGALAGSQLPLDVVGADEARQQQKAMLDQLDDYLLPRLVQLEAPVLVVVGGSTGAGKSTLVNTVIGKVVSEPGVLRPTTRSPVLIHHPADADWFVGDRVLPGMARTSSDQPGGTEDAGQLRLVAADTVPQGLAILDAPDIDSVVEANRDLATELLAAADLWLFVTTAARYSDAVPWDFLQSASDRSTAVAVVLDRAPGETIDDVTGHLAQMLLERGLGDSPLFSIQETVVDSNGMLPAETVASIKDWLTDLAADADARSAVVRRTLQGAVTAMVKTTPPFAAAVRAQADTAIELRSTAEAAYDQAVKDIAKATQDGTLLRGEVLARWQEFVGTGELLKGLQTNVGRMRDKVKKSLVNQPTQTRDVSDAIESGLESLLREQAAAAAERAEKAWQATPAGRQLLAAGGPELGAMSEDFPAAAGRTVREWQAYVLDLVRKEGADKRSTARILEYGVNGLGLSLMVVIFASGAGIPKAAEASAGAGSAVVGQKLLEAVFGDTAVRTLIEKAREDLDGKVHALMDAEFARYLAVLDQHPVDSETARQLTEAARAVEDCT